MAVYHELTDGFVVAASLQKTWDFFSTPENLASITPPWLKFTVRAPAPNRIEIGTLLNYTIRWMGVPIGWRTRIIDCAPPERFIDLQVRGPYRLWHHTHSFAAVDGGVECSDRVLYALPMGPFGQAIHALAVRNQLVEIFRYRRKVIADRLGWVARLQRFDRGLYELDLRVHHDGLWE